MLKLFLLRGFRTSLLLLVIAFISLFLVFYLSPNVGVFKSYVQFKVKQGLQAEKFEISHLQLKWDEGPAISLGQLSLDIPGLSIQDSYVQLSYSLLQVFKGGFAPRLKLRGGSAELNLDEGESGSAATPQPIYLLTLLDDVQLSWILQGEKQVFNHVAASILPNQSAFYFKADGINVHMALDEQQQLEKLQLQIKDFTSLPKSWSLYMAKMNALNIDVHKSSQQTWAWKADIQADDGILSIPQGHVKVPVSTLNLVGSLELARGKVLTLHQFEATSIQWRSHDYFADFSVRWYKNKLTLKVHDGSVQMPILWSWLWMLGDDDWHEWLNSMKHGQATAVKGSLDLPWHNPLQSGPTTENLQQMKFQVETNVSGADIALGLNGDFLYNVDAYVEVNQDDLIAHVSRAELNKDIGVIAGQYAIGWDSLVMDIQAKGEADLGKLHAWLEPESAKQLRWGSALSKASVEMKWDINKSLPDYTKVHMRPTKKSWHLNPIGSPITVSQGNAYWDINRGLELKNLKVSTSWLKGNLDLFLNQEWSLSTAHLDGFGDLATLTKEFALPIVKPEGATHLDLNFKDGKWLGNLNFTENDWENFVGFDKQAKEALNIRIFGKATTLAVLPIKIDHMDSEHEGFKFRSNVIIDKKKLDFQFNHINTAALKGDVRLLVPLEEKLPWGLDVQADYIEKSVMTKYLSGAEEDSKGTERPWNIVATSKKLVWGESYAENMRLQLASGKLKTGSFSSGNVVTKDVHLEQAKGSFTLLDTGRFELHYLEASSAGQNVIVSGSVKPKQGVYAWQAMAIVNGEFGKLMKQAELNQLFQDGNMNSLFLGKGEFKEGEPWWRGLKGSFRLRVDDGRLMQGGTLTHLLAAISLLDLPKYLAFQRSDVVKEGLLYDKLQVEATFDAEILDINQLAIRSSALDGGGKGTVNLNSGELDILLIARPWQNIEAIIGGIPLLGYVLTGQDKSFLRKVYRIHGPASDATVDELDPEDAGLPSSGLLEMLFSLPNTLFGN